MCIFFCFYSFITVTFVIEVMASANAIVAWRHIQHRKRVCLSQDSSINESESEVFRLLLCCAVYDDFSFHWHYIFYIK